MLNEELNIKYEMRSIYDTDERAAHYCQKMYPTWKKAEYSLVDSSAVLPHIATKGLKLY